MKRFYLLMCLPVMLFAACKKETADPPAVQPGTGNVSFLDNDSRYDSVHVNNMTVGGDGLVSAQLVHATDDDVAIILKSGSFDPGTQGVRKLEYLSAAGKTLLRKDVFTPTSLNHGQVEGSYYFFPPDSEVYFAGYTTQFEQPYVYRDAQQVISPVSGQGRPVVGKREQMAIIGNHLTKFFNNGSESDVYYNVRMSALYFDPAGTAGDHKAYAIAFRKDSNLLEVRAMNPGTPPPSIPGGPKSADLLLKEIAFGVNDSVRFAWVQGQTFGSNLYVLGVNYYTDAEQMLLNTYVYNSDSNIIRLVRSGVPTDGLVPFNFDVQPSNVSLHFTEDGGVWLSKVKVNSRGYDVYRLNEANNFELYNPTLRDEGFVQSVRTSRKRLYLTVGDGARRAEVIRLKQ